MIRFLAGSLLLTIALISPIFLRGQATNRVYPKLTQVSGIVSFLNHPELGKTPANFVYLMFRRRGGKDCIVGTKTDLGGKYEVFLTEGTYEVISFSPSPPTYDLLAPGQKRIVNVRQGQAGIDFDISLKLRAR